MDKKWVSYGEDITSKKDSPWRTLVVESLHGPVIMRVNNETGQAVPYSAIQDVPQAKDVETPPAQTQESPSKK
ncbi:hypothetical protein S40293_11199 [Stachybotrys chartarum IBT 40293]|nr:hypothetical protein S40293_11199 [Stachybotrys chartarum IBT 40293]